jgi:hypothetical protein
MSWKRAANDRASLAISSFSGRTILVIHLPHMKIKSNQIKSNHTLLFQIEKLKTW